jgi:hypothetical protein
MIRALFKCAANEFMSGFGLRMGRRLCLLGDSNQVLAAEPDGHGHGHGHGHSHGATPDDGAGVVIGHSPFNFDNILRVNVETVENFVSTRASPSLCALMEVT